MSLRPPPPPTPVSVDYDERLDLVVGKCKPGSVEETECYDQFLSHVREHMLSILESNALLFLAAGNGVLELRAAKHLITEAEEYPYKTPIKTILLLDPYADLSEAIRVTGEFKSALPGVETIYFYGIRAYDTALQVVHDRKSMKVGVIAGINFGTLIGLTPDGRNMANTTSALAQLLMRRLGESGSRLYAVQSMRTQNGQFVHRVETASEFAAFYARMADAMAREAHAKFYENK